MHGFVLVVLNRPDTARPCLNAAAQDADAMNEARVEVLCVRLDPASTIFPSEEILTNERRELRENDAAQWAAAANRAYNTWLDEHSDWAADRTSWSDPVSTIQHQVRVRGSGADLIVLPSPASPWDLDGQALRAAIFEADRPVLIIPNTPIYAMGRSIAIIWDEEQPTVRAVLDAMPLLAQAHEVFVLITIDRDATPSDLLPQLLIDHGVDAEIHAIQRARPIGKALREHTHHLGADLVVMGAYAHHPLIELMSGGLTRFMVSHADLPVLMRH